MKGQAAACPFLFSVSWEPSVTT